MVAIASVLVIVATNFVFYSFCTTWAGDYAWGLRYQAAVLGFLVLPLVVLFCDGGPTFFARLFLVTLGFRQCCAVGVSRIQHQS